MLHPDPANNALGEAIRRARLRNDLTQSELADRLGVSRALVGAWETGRSQPNQADLAEVKGLLGRIRREFDATPIQGSHIAPGRRSRRSDLAEPAPAARALSRTQRSTDAPRGKDDARITSPGAAQRASAAPRERGRRSNQVGATAGLDVPALEQWLWAAACEIRGPLDAPKFKDYILPLIFLKRLSDVFDDEVARVAEEIGDLEVAHQVVDDDHRLVRFYLPPEGRWAFVRNPAAWKTLPSRPKSLRQ